VYAYFQIHSLRFLHNLLALIFICYIYKWQFFSRYKSSVEKVIDSTETTKHIVAYSTFGRDNERRRYDTTYTHSIYLYHLHYQQQGLRPFLTVPTPINLLPPSPPMSSHCTSSTRRLTPYSLAVELPDVLYSSVVSESLSILRFILMSPLRLRSKSMQPATRLKNHISPDYLICSKGPDFVVI
jgi:hypothetical protein